MHLRDGVFLLRMLEDIVRDNPELYTFIFAMHAIPMHATRFFVTHKDICQYVLFLIANIASPDPVSPDIDMPIDRIYEIVCEGGQIITPVFSYENWRERRETINDIWKAHTKEILYPVDDDQDVDLDALEVRLIDALDALEIAVHNDEFDRDTFG